MKPSAASSAAILRIEFTVRNWARSCYIIKGMNIHMLMPYREGKPVAESGEGPTASKSDRTGRNPGMTRLVRRSSATSGGTAFFSIVETFRQPMHKCSDSPIPSLPKN